MRTQVAIVGAGPSGLMLGQLLQRAGIDNVILELRSAEYVLGRIRAGVIESGSAKLLDDCGAGARMRREGLVHAGFELCFGGARHRIDIQKLVGRNVIVYGQTEITRDLMECRAATGGVTVYEAEQVQLSGIDAARPRLRYQKDGTCHELECDFIAGC